LSYFAEGLNPGTQINFEIQAIGPCSTSEIISTNCTTGSCNLNLEIDNIAEPECDVPDSGIITVQADGGNAPYIYRFGSLENENGIFEKTQTCVLRKL